MIYTITHLLKHLAASGLEGSDMIDCTSAVDGTEEKYIAINKQNKSIYYTYKSTL